MKSFYCLIIILLLFSPTISKAELIISEIMYDLEGSDSQKEWIEIHNSGDTSIDIETWFFFEAGVHHKLIPDTFNVLEPNERALIVQDIETIRSQYGDSLKLVKSSFSLNNTGEEIGVSNAQKEIIDLVFYSSEWGANGNGLSLQRTQDGNWVQGNPTPGKINITQSETSVTENDEKDTQEQNKEQKIDYYTAQLDFSETLLARSPVRFRAFVEHTKDNKKLELNRGYYQINMGDGHMIESGERIDQEYVYQYPGIYEVNLEYYSSKLAFEADVPPIASLQKTVQVYAPEVYIETIDLESGISIQNNTNTRIHLGGWKIVYKNQEYIFPRNTYVPRSAQITISRATHGIIITDYQWVTLHNELGITIDSFKKETNKFSSMEHQVNVLPEDQSKIQDQEIDMTDRYLLQHPDKLRVDFGTAQYIPDTLYSQQRNHIPWWILIVLASFAIPLSFIKLFLNKEKENTEILGDIQLLDKK